MVLDRKRAGTPPDDLAGPAQDAPARYTLRLFVTGMTPRSTRAIENIRAVCEERLRGRYELEVIDLYQNPAVAKREQIVAAPTLIKQLPLPLRRLIGDLSDEQQLLVGLDLQPAARANDRG